MADKIKMISGMGKNYLRYKAGRPRPFFCVYTFTLACNYNCRYCPIIFDTGSEASRGAQDVKQRPEMTTEQARYAVDWLRKIGTVGISFTGGEPLLKENLEEIAAYAKKRGLFNVLNTNASLVTEERARALGDCFNSVTISLWGSRETDNALRGDRAYEKTTSGIRIFKKETKLKININFVINRDNYREIDFILDYARINGDSVTFLPLNYVPDSLLDVDTASHVQEKLVAVKKRCGAFVSNSMNNIKMFSDFLTGGMPHFDCDPFDVYFGLGPDGGISGCCSYYHFVGNVLSMSPDAYQNLKGEYKEALLARCGGCSSPLCRELSALYRRPIAGNILMVHKYLDLLLHN